jgi:hypothetical protein
VELPDSARPLNRRSWTVDALVEQESTKGLATVCLTGAAATSTKIAG